jgi:hypothetical protein
LHTLLWALSFLKDKPWELHLFGKDDDLGSPLMGLPQVNYLNTLKELISSLNLGDRVHFHGHCSIEEIESFTHSRSVIFTTPSLHSDENFGLALYRSLHHGHQAVITRWGGHHEFLTHFPNQTIGVNVFHSPIGPYVDTKELTEALAAALKAPPSPPPPLSSIFKTKSLLETIDSLVISLKNFVPLKLTPLANDLFQRRQYFTNEQKNERSQGKLALLENNRGHQIFSSYTDLFYLPLHRAYGAITPAHETLKNYELAPWVKLNGSLASVSDPHRGNFELSIEELQNTGLITQKISYDGKDD